MEPEMANHLDMDKFSTSLLWIMKEEMYVETSAYCYIVINYSQTCLKQPTKGNTQDDCLKQVAVLYR